MIAGKIQELPRSFKIDFVIMNCSIFIQVSKTWYKLCNSNELWKGKAMAMRLKKPPQADTANWKVVYQENKNLEKNWSAGNFKQVDLRGHKDK